MVKVFVEEDCDNAPKKQFIRDITIAYANCDVQKVLAGFTDDVRWSAPGDWEMSGKTVVAESLNHLMSDDIIEMTITNIISHGDRCALNGIIRLKDGHTVAFCDFYRFTSHASDAKIKEITTYIKDFKPLN